MPALPPLTALRAFEAAARHLSFNRAAADLHVTPSAVSHQIHALEGFLGFPLFRRDGRRVALTAAGKAFLPPLQSAFDQLVAATRQVSAIYGKGPLTISAAPSFAMGWLVPRLPAFQIAHPDIEIRLNTSCELVDLAHSDIDVGIRTGRGRWPGLASHRLMTETLVPVCSPALARRKPGLRRPADLAKAVLLQDLGRLGRWRSWLAAVDVAVADPESGPKFQTTATAVEAAVAGLGVAIADPRMIEAHLKDGRLVAPFDLELASENAYYFVYPETRGDVPKIACFRDWLLAEAAEGAAIAS
jgi:LysR family glycine cleavage system transcriptional activator